MGPMLARILALLKTIVQQLGVFFAAEGASNLVGWGVGAVVTTAFLALWVAVLHLGWSYIMDGFNSAAGGGSIFGVGLPAGSIWLIQQAFPLQLFFSLTVTYITVRLTAAKALIIAIAASRYLKGK